MKLVLMNVLLENERICVNSTTIKTKTCGNYDSDSCLEWSSYSYSSCSDNEECKDGSCVKIEINCTNECNVKDYPKCKNEKTIDGVCKIQKTQQIEEI